MKAVLVVIDWDTENVNSFWEFDDVDPILDAKRMWIVIKKDNPDCLHFVRGDTEAVAIHADRNRRWVLEMLEELNNTDSLFG